MRNKKIYLVLFPLIFKVLPFSRFAPPNVASYALRISDSEDSNSDSSDVKTEEQEAQENEAQPVQEQEAHTFELPVEIPTAPVPLGWVYKTVPTNEEGPPSPPSSPFSPSFFISIILSYCIVLVFILKNFFVNKNNEFIDQTVEPRNVETNQTGSNSISEDVKGEKPMNVQENEFIDQTVEPGNVETNQIGSNSIHNGLMSEVATNVSYINNGLQQVVNQTQTLNDEICLIQQEMDLFVEQMVQRGSINQTLNSYLELQGVLTQILTFSSDVREFLSQNQTINEIIRSPDSIEERNAIIRRLLDFVRLMTNFFNALLNEMSQLGNQTQSIPSTSNSTDFTIPITTLLFDLEAVINQTLYQMTEIENNLDQMLSIEIQTSTSNRQADEGEVLTIETQTSTSNRQADEGEVLTIEMGEEIQPNRVQNRQPQTRSANPDPDPQTETQPNPNSQRGLWEKLVLGLLTALTILSLKNRMNKVTKGAFSNTFDRRLLNSIKNLLSSKPLLEKFLYYFGEDEGDGNSKKNPHSNINIVITNDSNNQSEKTSKSENNINSLDKTLEIIGSVFSWVGLFFSTAYGKYLYDKNKKRNE